MRCAWLFLVHWIRRARLFSRFLGGSSGAAGGRANSHSSRCCLPPDAPGPCARPRRPPRRTTSFPGSVPATATARRPHRERHRVPRTPTDPAALRWSTRCRLFADSLAQQIMNGFLRPLMRWYTSHNGLVHFCRLWACRSQLPTGYTRPPPFTGTLGRHPLVR